MLDRALTRYGGDCDRNDRQVTTRNRQPSLPLARYGGGDRDVCRSSSYREPASASYQEPARASYRDPPRASYREPSFAAIPIPIFAIPSRQTSTRARYDNSGDEYSRPRRARTIRAGRSTRDMAYSSDEEYSRPRRGIRATIRDAISRRLEGDPCDSTPRASVPRRQPRHTPERIYCEDPVYVRRTSSPEPVRHRVSRSAARAMVPSCEIVDSDFDWDSDGYLTSPDRETARNSFHRAEAFAPPPRVSENTTTRNPSTYPSLNLNDRAHLRVDNTTPSPTPQQRISYENNSARARSRADTQPSLSLGDRSHLRLDSGDRSHLRLEAPRRTEARDPAQRDEEADMAFASAIRGARRAGRS